MTNQETNSAESQSQSDAALAHQHETSVPTGEQREREPSRQISNVKMARSHRDPNNDQLTSVQDLGSKKGLFGRKPYF